MQQATITPLPRSNADDVFLTKEAVMERYSMSESTVRRRVTEGILPKPIWFGGQTYRWSRAELVAMEEKRRTSVQLDFCTHFELAA